MASRSASAPKSFARPAQPVSAARPSRWRWLLAGLLMGIGATLGGQWLLAGSWSIDALQTAGTGSAAPAPQAGPRGAVGGEERALPRFEFYDLLPQERVPVVPSVEERRGDGRVIERSTAPARAEFLLQAGSFLAPEDAETRRVQILLLDLTAFVHEVRLDDGQRWHRVLVGPFESRSAMETARSRLEGERIGTLALKPAP